MLELDQPRGDTTDRVVILIPNYNDWESLSPLLGKLDDVLADRCLEASVLVVDDGSTRPAPASLSDRPLRAIDRVDVLTLRRNLGHQRAIALGLAYLEDRVPCDVVVVMDGDGEDDPADVPRLLAKLQEEGGRSIVFAERTRRSESWRFRFFYRLYKLAHAVLTGQGVRVGNFSAIPRRRLESLVVVSELWNHYAAAAFRSRQPFCTIPTRRAKRLRGRSTMNFVGLVTHGLSAISVHSEVVGVRLLVMVIGLAALALIGLGGTVFIRLGTDLAIPGWATDAAGILVLLLVQLVGLAFGLSIMILGGRNGTSFIPRRDYDLFLGEIRTLCSRRAGPTDRAPTEEAVVDVGSRV
jgi:hypothetical protein